MCGWFISKEQLVPFLFNTSRVYVYDKFKPNRLCIITLPEKIPNDNNDGYLRYHKFFIFKLKTVDNLQLKIERRET